MKMKAVVLLIAVAPFLSGCTTGSGVGAERMIRLAHGLDPSHPVHQAMGRMGELLAEKSGGRMHLEIYPSEQLGTERQALELLQLGSLDMTKVSSAVMEGFSPLYKALGMPYVFRSEDHRFKVLDGPVGERILTSSTEEWLRGLCYYDAGSRSFYTRDTPIRRPEDLEGLKIRVMSSPVSIQMVNMMGGSATPVSWGELYTALQQGVVDGAENNPPSLHLSRQYEVTGYYSLDKHTALPDVLLISTHLWEDLSEQERQWLQEAVDESVQYQRKLWKEASREALKTVEEAGVEIIRPDPKPFAEAVEPLYERYRKEAPAIYALVEQIRAVQTDSARAASVGSQAHSYRAAPAGRSAKGTVQ